MDVFWIRNGSNYEPVPIMNLSIKNVPEDLVRKLKERAKANHRSLQGEVVATLEKATSIVPARKTIREVGEDARKLNLPSISEAAALVRMDRDSH
jgi:antitoxin FitA